MTGIEMNRRGIKEGRTGRTLDQKKGGEREGRFLAQCLGEWCY